MRKDRLYLYTFLSLLILFLIGGGISARYFVKLSAGQMLETQLESGTREATEIATMAGLLFQEEVPSDLIRQAVQSAISETNYDLGFISVLNWSGRIVAHPDITLVGVASANEGDTGITMNQKLEADEIYDYIEDASNQESNQIIALIPVANSDWMIASHANISKITTEVNELRNKFYVLFGIMGLVLILTSVVIVRFIGSNYEKRLEVKNQQLESEVINLAKLNSDLGNYQRRVETNRSSETVAENLQEDAQNKEINKRRILTYLRNELLAVPIEDLSYIYTENTITYVVDIRGKKSTTNSSLDELFAGLDENYFYRANRQFIIAVTAIDKIIKYGNNQLKILVNPNSEVDIIIGKNKAAEFKKWLNS